jgi:hypothetical protein
MLQDEYDQRCRYHADAKGKRFPVPAPDGRNRAGSEEQGREAQRISRNRQGEFLQRIPKVRHSC